MALPELSPVDGRDEATWWKHKRADGLWILVYKAGPHKPIYVSLVTTEPEERGTPVGSFLNYRDHQDGINADPTELEAEILFDAFMNGFTPEVTP